MSERLASQGALPVGNTSEEFARFVKGEMDQWGKLAQKIGLKPGLTASSFRRTPE